MKQINEMMSRLHNPDLGTLFIRIALGIVFINAGLLKMLDMDMTIVFFGSVGIPTFLAYFVTYAELLCGIALILGVFVRYCGIILAIIMLYAIRLAFANGFSLASGGYEYTFVLMLGALALITLGSGKYSLAYMLKKKKQEMQGKISVL